MTPKLNLYPYILIQNIPIDRVLSFMGTGIGTGYEYEFVVLGGMYPKDTFFILQGTRIGTKLLIQGIAKQEGIPVYPPRMLHYKKFIASILRQYPSSYKNG